MTTLGAAGVSGSRAPSTASLSRTARRFGAVPCREQEAVARHKIFQSPHGDHLTQLNIFKQYRETGRKKRSEWCKLHFLNAKALSTALRVFEQLEVCSSCGLATQLP